jgi:hypothetical protein
MTDRRAGVYAAIEPGEYATRLDGSRVQLVRVVLEGGRNGRGCSEAVCSLMPVEACRLAVRLLELAYEARVTQL